VEKAAAIDSVVFVVVRNVIGHNIGFWFWLLRRLPYTCLYWFGWILFPKSFRIRARAAVIFRNSSFAGATFDACPCKNAALRRWPGAAFELTKYGQSPTYSLCAASAALARELINCRN
jgi:hypothetical protein